MKSRKGWSRLVLWMILAAPASMAQAQPVRITGRIVQPLPGSTVELQSYFDTRAESLRRLTGESIPPLVSTKPRADGSFELKTPEPGFYSVVVRAEGRLARKNRLTFVVEDVELPPVELPATAPLRVRAVGPDGLPLAGVAIQALPVRPREDEWGADDRRAVTDADGRATFPRAEGEALRLMITTPGRYGVAQTGPSGSEQTVAFPKPGSRVVELRGPLGKPAAGALVRIGRHGWPFGLTGEDGRIALPVPEKDEEIGVFAEDAKGLRIEIVMTAEAGEGTDVPVVSLRPPTTVTGQILDAATRQPLARALVWNGGTSWVRSDPRGGFELRAPSGDRAWVEAQAPGRVRHRRRWTRDDNKPITFALEAAGNIGGLVVDEAGKPLAGARILTVPNPASRTGEIGGESVAWSGADGRFVLRSLPANRLHSVTASLNGFAPASQLADASSGPPIRFQLGRGATAVGRVVDESGQPVAGADLTLMPATESPVPDLGVGSFQAVSDAEGRFRIPHLSAGPFRLQARREGFAAAAEEVSIPEKPAETDLEAVVLTPGAAIEGIVVDGRGKPIAGVDVEAEPFEDEMRFDLSASLAATTGPDGRFRFADLPRGRRLGLWIDHPGFVEAHMPGVEAPTAKPVRIQLVEARSLAGRVVDPEGQPVAEARVALVETAVGHLLGGGFAETPGSSQARTDADGRFVLDRLPPGTVGIEVRAASFRNRSLPGISIPEEGEATPVEISLEPGPVLEGRVLDSQGRPVPRAMIRAEGRVLDKGQRFSFGGTRTDDEGRYRIDGLEPGPHTVMAQPEEGGPGAQAAVEVHVGPNRLDLSLPSGVEVSGRVVDGRGMPVAGAAVWLQGSPQTAWGLPALSSADGSFLIRDVPEGDYRLLGGRRGFGRSEAPETIQVGAAPVQGLEIRLAPGAAIRGRILGLTPADRGRVLVTALGEEAVSSSLIEVSAEGDYRIPDVSPGTWTVLAQLPSQVSVQGQVQIGDGDQEVVLDLQLPTGATLSGRITRDGKPLPGTMVFVQLAADENRMQAQAQTAWDGTFRLERLPPATYKLLVLVSPEAPYTRLVEIDGDREVMIEIPTSER